MDHCVPVTRQGYPNPPTLPPPKVLKKSKYSSGMEKSVPAPTRPPNPSSTTPPPSSWKLDEVCLAINKHLHIVLMALFLPLQTFIVILLSYVLSSIFIGIGSALFAVLYPRLFIVRLMLSCLLMAFVASMVYKYAYLLLSIYVHSGWFCSSVDAWIFK